jgi:polysaccharide biosynthesis protein PslJ
MYVTNPLQEWIARLDRRTYAILIGVAIGAAGGLVGLLLAVAGPIIAFGVLLGGFAGLYILTSINAALYGIIAVMALLPFATFPFRIGFTPTFMDAVMGAFLAVYLVQWMTGRRHSIRLTPVHILVALYMGWLILSFVLGVRYARPTSANLRQFAETILSIGMVFILVDLLRDAISLRRLVLVIMMAVGVQALVATVLWVAPDDIAERTLVRLASIGYPDGGVIRYIEDNPDDTERAIGTWVDPNALGGFLAVSAALIAPQVFARNPVLRNRWIAWGVLSVIGVALLLTSSRASMLAFGIGLLFIGLFKGYRRFLVLLLLGVALVLLLPQTRGLVERFVEAFTAQDLATQMRLGEYGDALELISRYPIAGVGFTGTPEIDLYTDVASMYLIMANQIGLVGVALFALVIFGVFMYGASAWRAVQHDTELRSIFLGCHAALIAALLNATADLYFFRLDFHASITLFWLVVALALTCSRLALERELTVAKPTPIM